jgi:hypothetical protein
MGAERWWGVVGFVLALVSMDPAAAQPRTDAPGAAPACRGDFEAARALLEAVPIQQRGPAELFNLAWLARMMGEPARLGRPPSPLPDTALGACSGAPLRPGLQQLWARFDSGHLPVEPIRVPGAAPPVAAPAPAAVAPPAPSPAAAPQLARAASPPAAVVAAPPAAVAPISLPVPAPTSAASASASAPAAPVPTQAPAATPARASTPATAPAAATRADIAVAGNAASGRAESRARARAEARARGATDAPSPPARAAAPPIPAAPGAAEAPSRAAGRPVALTRAPADIAAASAPAGADAPGGPGAARPMPLLQLGSYRSAERAQSYVAYLRGKLGPTVGSRIFIDGREPSVRVLLNDSDPLERCAQLRARKIDCRPYEVERSETREEICARLQGMRIECRPDREAAPAARRP